MVRGLIMIGLISGVVVTGAGGATLWYFMPSNGRVHPITVKPLLDSLIPIAIVSTLGIGLAMIVAGIASL